MALRMFLFPRRRSYLVSFSFTGILLLLIFINKHSIPQTSSLSSSVRKDLPVVQNEEPIKSTTVDAELYHTDLQENIYSKDITRNDSISKDNAENKETISNKETEPDSDPIVILPNSSYDQSDRFLETPLDEIDENHVGFIVQQNNKSSHETEANYITTNIGNLNENIQKIDEILGKEIENANSHSQEINAKPSFSETVNENVQQVESIPIDVKDIIHVYQEQREPVNGLQQTNLENAEQVKDNVQDHRKEKSKNHFEQTEGNNFLDDHKIKHNIVQDLPRNDNFVQDDHKTTKGVAQISDVKEQHDKNTDDDQPYLETQNAFTSEKKTTEYSDQNKNVNIKIKFGNEHTNGKQSDLFPAEIVKVQENLGSNAAQTNKSSNFVLSSEQKQMRDEILNINDRESSASLRKVKAIDETSINAESNKTVNKTTNQQIKPMPKSVKKIKEKNLQPLDLNYYKVLYESLIRLNKRTLRKMFAKLPKDIDFVPGKKVEFNKVRRVLIASNWRSGSTFLGDILISYPATFYSFEPLHISFRNIHLQYGENVTKALDLLKGLYSCNFTAHPEYVKYLQEYLYVIQHNKFMWNSCYSNRAFCFDANFLTEICQQTPLNVIKTVRLGMVPIGNLLDDKNLDIKVIHLVRDPRGSLHSRMKLTWCKSDICKDPKTVCDSLNQDLLLSEEYVKKYPTRFLLLRYEDLSLDPENVTKDLLDFLGLHYHESIKRALQAHTTVQDQKKKGNDETYTTFRDSQSIPFAWRDSLPFDQVKTIQDGCQNTISSLGFTNFKTEEEYLNKNISVFYS